MASSAKKVTNSRLAGRSSRSVGGRPESPGYFTLSDCSSDNNGGKLSPPGSPSKGVPVIITSRRTRNETSCPPLPPPPPAAYTSTLPPPVPRKTRPRPLPASQHTVRSSSKPLQKIQPLQIQSPSLIKVFKSTEKLSVRPDHLPRAASAKRSTANSSCSSLSSSDEPQSSMEYGESNNPKQR